MPLASRSGAVSVPDARRLAQELALHPGATVSADVEADGDGGAAEAGRVLVVRIVVHDDETAEAVAAFLATHTLASAKAFFAGSFQLAVVAMDRPRVSKHVEGAAATRREAQTKLERLLLAREKLEEGVMDRQEVGETHSLDFDLLLRRGSQVAQSAVQEALGAAAAGGRNRLQQVIPQLFAGIGRWTASLHTSSANRRSSTGRGGAPSTVQRSGAAWCSRHQEGHCL